MDQDRGQLRLGEPPREVMEDLRNRFGFVEEEAAAYWHLQRAQWLVADLEVEDAGAEHERRAQEADERGDDLGDTFSLFRDSILDQARYEDRIGAHFSAIRRALLTRVAARDYPDGWGGDSGPPEDGSELGPGEEF